jgi:uncharacterized protein
MQTWSASHQASAFRPAAEHALARARSALSNEPRGLVRRCHGDLHLGNIVMIGGRPVVFDALEFDEALATIDVLYDLAFLLMDLMQRDQGPAANRVLNRYLQGAHGNEDGLAALPLFLGLRAGIRAMVIAERAAQGGSGCSGAADYLSTALELFDPPPPRLIAVGGYSGTGKTTLAAALAPDIGARPGRAAPALRRGAQGAVWRRGDDQARCRPLRQRNDRPGLWPHRGARAGRFAGRAFGHRRRGLCPAGRAPADRRRGAAAGAGFTGIWLSAPGRTPHPAGLGATRRCVGCHSRGGGAADRSAAPAMWLGRPSTLRATRRRSPPPPGRCSGSR